MPRVLALAVRHGKAAAHLDLGLVPRAEQRADHTRLRVVAPQEVVEDGEEGHLIGQQASHTPARATYRMHLDPCDGARVKHARGRRREAQMQRRRRRKRVLSGHVDARETKKCRPPAFRGLGPRGPLRQNSFSPGAAAGLSSTKMAFSEETKVRVPRPTCALTDAGAHCARHGHCQDGRALRLVRFRALDGASHADLAGCRL